MPRTLRWGILGPGHIAEKQTRDLLAHDVAVTAVGSRSAERAQQFAKTFGIGRAHGSYAELVADDDVDAVYVASPHSHHYEHARLALEAGKHVLCEKAFTVTAQQAAVLVELAEKRGLVLLEAMWTRFLPHMARIREVIAAGTIGEVRTVIADHLQRLPTAPDHRLNNPHLAGGALLDLGIYPISFAWDILGAPSSIKAVGAMSATGVDRSTSVVLGYPGGEQAIVTTALDARGPNRASIVATEGRIEIEATWYAPTAFTVYDSDDGVVERYETDIVGEGSQFQAFEVERLVGAGLTAGTILPPSESVAIMGSLDEIRRQIGLDYPADIIGV